MYLDLDWHLELRIWIDTSTIENKEVKRYGYILGFSTWHRFFAAGGALVVVSFSSSLLIMFDLFPATDRWNWWMLWEENPPIWSLSPNQSSLAAKCFLLMPTYCWYNQRSKQHVLAVLMDTDQHLILENNVKFWRFLTATPGIWLCSVQCIYECYV